MNRKAVGIGIGVVVLVVLGVVSTRAGGRKTPTRVYAEKVARRDITHAVKAAGQIQARVSVNISAHVVGKIEKLMVEEGDRIESGAPFLQLERQFYQAARDDARAGLAMATTEKRRAEVALADQAVKLARARKLVADEISAAESLEAAELAHTSAQLAVDSAQEGANQARAVLGKAEDDLRKTTIFAPISGRVVALNAKEGEVVVSGTMNNPASVIGTIADLSEILVEIEVDETDVVHLREDQAARVEVDALPEVEYAGRVVEVGSSGFAKPQQPDVQLFRVKVLLERPDERLRPGMSARATIEVETRTGALVVPLQAVVERKPLEAAGTAPETKRPPTGGRAGDEAPALFVVDTGKARQRTIVTGLSDATHVEIVGGIAEGDQVVTGPYRALKKLDDGTPVKVADPKLDDAKKAERDRTDDEDDEDD
jgi:HlyD family secretion protein